MNADGTNLKNRTVIAFPVLISWFNLIRACPRKSAANYSAGAAGVLAVNHGDATQCLRRQPSRSYYSASILSF
jgi:hypothetical protein